MTDQDFFWYSEQRSRINEVNLASLKIKNKIIFFQIKSININQKGAEAYEKVNTVTIADKHSRKYIYISSN